MLGAHVHVHVPLLLVAAHDACSLCVVRSLWQRAIRVEDLHVRRGIARVRLKREVLRGFRLLRVVPRIHEAVVHMLRRRINLANEHEAIAEVVLRSLRFPQLATTDVCVGWLTRREIDLAHDVC